MTREDVIKHISKQWNENDYSERNILYAHRNMEYYREYMANHKVSLEVAVEMDYEDIGRGISYSKSEQAILKMVYGYLNELDSQRGSDFIAMIADRIMEFSNLDSAEGIHNELFVN